MSGANVGATARAFEIQGVRILEQGDSTLTGSTTTPVATDALVTRLLGTYATGSGTGSAEVVAFEASRDRLFVMNNVSDRIEIVNLSDPTKPAKTGEIDVAALVSGYDASPSGSGMNSIAVARGVLAVAIEAPVKSDPGTVALFSTATGQLIKTLTVGALPDMLTFTPDGRKLLVANEGENPGQGEVESAGSVSLIDLTNGAAAATVSTTGFAALDGSEAGLRAAGVRLFDGLSASVGLEPEYIDVSADGTRAFVTLQENNAVATFDITGTGPVLLSILPLGFVDHALAGNEGDFSDRDGPGTGSNSQGKINIVTAPIKGLLMPDAISTWTVAGVTYFATANEGDSRVDGSDEARLSSLDLNDAVFGSQEAALKSEDYAGRLTVSNIDGNIDPTQAGFEEIVTFGGRGMSIFRQNADGTITKVSDTGAEFEKIIAALPNAGTVFNQNGESDGVSFDTRSDNKAGEPEGIDVAQIGDKTYAFVGLERQGGVMIYDVTNPADPTYVKYLAPADGDRAPEIVKYVPAGQSPTGAGMLLVANEVSGTVTAYAIDLPDSAPYRLQILHGSDFEAGLNAVDRAGNFAAIVDYLEDTQTHSITLSSGDNFLPSPFFNAGSDPSLKEVYETALETYYGLAAGTLAITPGLGTADIAMLDIIGVQASAMGNHEFDAGTSALATLIRQTSGNPGAQFPYLAANLDFSGDANLRGLYADTVRNAADYSGFPPAAGIGTKIAPATIIEEGGERIGVVGATTQIVQSISSTGGVEVKGPNTDDMAALAQVLQPTIDALIAQGIDKIVLVSHLQQLALEKALAPLLKGVDVIVAGGSHTLMADANDVARGLQPGDTAAETYPFVTTNADGKTTVIVNTANEYSYVGRLVVEFDQNGDIIADSIDPTVSGAYATTDKVVDDLYAKPIDIDGDGSVDADPFADGTRGALVNDIAEGVGAVINRQDSNIFGKTAVYLEGRRGEVRTEETNLGNLSADANLWYAKKADDTVLVSIKNGGGIRDSIGTISADPTNPAELPPAANPEAGKAAGDVSQLDIANSLRFNNALSLITVTADQLLAVLEHAVAASGPGATPGQFAQIGGIGFSYDPDLPTGQRVVSAALIDEAGHPTRALVQDGAVVADAPAAIRVVTLSFLVTGGDGYPFKDFVAANPSFANVVALNADTIPDATQVANFAAEGTEQDAFAEYLAAFYRDTAYGERDTGPTQDERIQNLDVRNDTVLPGAEPTFLVEQGAFEAPLAFGAPGAAGITYTVADLPEAGTLRFGNTVVAVGDTLTAAQLAALTYTVADNAPTGRQILGLSYTEGGAARGFEVSLQVTAAVSATYIGTAGADRIDGAAGDDRLKGLAGDDVLLGGRGNDALDGGAGRDLLTGGTGDDAYAVDNAGDQVIEAAGGGNDIVFATASYRLAAGQEIEALQLLAATGRAALDLFGNAFDQRLVGNNGNNTLDGGAGADVMIGRGGNDAYGIDSANDQVIEAVGGGNDIVFSSVSYTLAAGQEIEGLQLGSSTGRAALNLKGNAFDQRLVGNNGNNTLDGGAGADVLIGRGGNDAYGVDNVDDQVIEAVGGGNDIVFASVSYTLAAGQEIEGLQLGSSTGRAALDLTGNAFGQRIVGNNGNNTLDGGAGADVLIGRGGSDTFVFSTALGSGNVDTIVDFSGADTIRLSASIFSALSAGELDATAFKDVGTGATVDASDRIVYDSRTGALSYDADGSGAGAAVRFATLENKAALSADDFLVA